MYDKNISFLFFKGSRTRSQRSHFNTRLPGMCIYIYKICKLYDTHHHVPMYAKYEHIYRQTTLWNKYILYTYPLFNVVVGVYIYIFYKVDIKSEYIRLNDLLHVPSIKHVWWILIYYCVWVTQIRIYHFMTSLIKKRNVFFC